MPDRDPVARATVAELVRTRRFGLYLASRIALIIATQMLSVTVGWQVYERTGRPLDLGYTGLALFLPGFLLALPGGHTADRFDRRRILLVCHLGVAAGAATLAGVSLWPTHSLAPIFAVLLLLGAVRAFSGAASQALLPALVPAQDLERAVAIGSSSWQIAMIAGPAIGGAVYTATGQPAKVYALCTLFALLAFVSVLAVGGPARRSQGRISWSELGAGIRFVRSDKPILAAISLDLFAVLFGGAVALLPIFARDVLRIGPMGLGILRSAPSVGATVMALWLAWFPLQRHAGRTMLAAVLAFGLATIAFGQSRSFVVSLFALFAIGALDMVSVVVRSTLIQLRTPDAMRGRVSAVNMVFIGASNELGEFESGVTAEWLGPVRAVVVGGIGTCLVVLAWCGLFPELLRMERLTDDVRPRQPKT